MNFRPVRGPYGGGNQFLRALRGELERRGHMVTNHLRDSFDVALLNALMQDLDLDFVRRVAERGPVVHRKVGYRVSGLPHMRRVEDGVVRGDKLQIEFSPHVTHTVFQSSYSRDVFHAEGFSGAHSVIHNGVDDAIFNQWRRATLPRRGGRRQRRSFWDGNRPLRVIVSSWSPDPSKGFDELARIDRDPPADGGVQLDLVGRTPPETHFRHVRLLRPRAPHRVAALLKDRDVLLQLARHETCSNALLEGINCGLPAVYLDSGANAEVASAYGVEYRGDLAAALGELRARWDEIVPRLEDNPYRIGAAADRYLAVLERAAEGRQP